MSGIVAVTGATGFIGRQLVRTLAARGIRQRLLVRRLPDLPVVAEAGSIELVVGDLADLPTLRHLVRDASAVIHLAGAIKARHTADFFEQNAHATRDLLATMAATGASARFLLISSLAAREPHLSDYAASKRAGEDYLVGGATAHGWAAIRAPAVYGPGDIETLPFFRWVKRGLAPVPAGGGGRLSLIHVVDLCTAVAAALARPLPDGIYEIDDGEIAGHSLPEMAAVAAGVFGRRPRILGVPRAAMTGVAGMQQLMARALGRPAILSPGKVREIFHDNWVITDRRLAAALDFVPQFDLRGGFADTIHWYARNRWL